MRISIKTAKIITLGFLLCEPDYLGLCGKKKNPAAMKKKSGFKAWFNFFKFGRRWLIGGPCNFYCRCLDFALALLPGLQRALDLF